MFVPSAYETCEQGPFQVVLDFPEAPEITNTTIINPTTATSNDGAVLANASPNTFVIKGTFQFLGSTALDSNADPSSGQSNLFNFDPNGVDELSIDAGFFRSCPPNQRGAITVQRK